MSEEAVPQLDPKTFDLGAWIQDKHSYPIYHVTVHLDGDAALRANKALARIEELDKELPDLEKKSQASAGSGSLGETSAASAAFAKAGRERSEKVREHKAAYDQAKSSALKISFQSKGGNSFKRVREQLTELHEGILEMSQPQLFELFNERPELGERQGALLFLDVVSSITNPKGEKIDLEKLTVEQVEGLLKRLSTSETGRVQTNINLALAGAELREEEIDAGFPR